MKASRFPRQPLIGLAFGAFGGILIAEFVAVPILPLCLGIAGTALLGIIRPTPWLTHSLVVAAFFALHLCQLTDAPGKELKARLGDAMRPITATGIVNSEVKLSPNDYSSSLLQLKKLDLGGHEENSRAVVRVRCKSPAQFGDEIQLHGAIEPIPPARNPGVFDLKTYFARRDVYQGIFARYPDDVSIQRTNAGDFVRRSATRARHWMQRTLSRGLEDSPEVVALLNGMVLGLRHDSPDDIEEPFQQTGTLHLFAVAGLHVGIVAQLLWITASLLRLPRVMAAAAIIPCLFFYSAITGFHVSSVRAATMAAFLLGGILFDRPALAINNLAGAAVVILAVDSNQLFTSGFQLSFAVVGTILLLAEPFARILLRAGRPDPFLPRVLLSRGQRIFQGSYRWGAQALSVSGAAWIGSLPLIIWYFYLITPISLLANLAVIPVAFCALAVALISLVAAPVSSQLVVVLNNANWSLAKLILVVVGVFARLPTGHVYVERPHWPSGAATELTVLDAGAGAAVHLRSDGLDWLFDAGSMRDYESFLRDYLHSRGINRLDGLVLSHGDSLHIGGAAAVLEEFKSRRVIDNASPDHSSVHRFLTVRYPQRELAVRGTDFALAPHVAAKIFYPPAGLKSKATDDTALVVQLVIDHDHRVLLVSDSGPTTEQALRVRPEQLRSEILIKGRHFSGAATSAEFLEAVRPQLIIATSVDFPSREHIPDEWAAMVKRRGIPLFRQDTTGAVTLEFFPDYWRATSFLTHETLRSSSR